MGMMVAAKCWTTLGVVFFAESSRLQFGCSYYMYICNMNICF